MQEAAGAGEGGEGKRSRSKKRDGPTFDFENLEDVPEGAFAMPSKDSDINMVSNPTAVNTLLPHDLQYKASGRGSRANRMARGRARSEGACLVGWLGSRMEDMLAW